MQIHREMPEAQYHALDDIGSTTLRDVSQRGALLALWHAQHNPVQPNDAMIFGTVCHSLVVPQQGAELAWDRDAVVRELMRLGGCESYAVGPEARRNSKAWTSWAADQPEGVALLKPSDLVATEQTADRALACARAVRSCEAARPLLEGAQCETSILWTDERTGLRCKARIDALSWCGGYVTDLKCTTAADPASFIGPRGIVWTRRYLLQAAYYLDAARMAGLADDSTQCTYIAAHPEAPHPVGVYHLPAEAVDVGRRLYRSALDAIAAYHARGGAEAALAAGWERTAELPAWVRNL